MAVEDRLFGMSGIRKQIEMKYFVSVGLWIASGWRTRQGSVYKDNACVSEVGDVTDWWGVF
jgi:hypothetical protein